MNQLYANNNNGQDEEAAAREPLLQNRDDGPRGFVCWHDNGDGTANVMCMRRVNK
jgi:hypothetical protein